MLALQEGLEAIPCGVVQSINLDGHKTRMGQESQEESLVREDSIRVSLGTAIALGLIRGRMDAPPTTAYLLTPGGCHGICKFCPQASTSAGRSDLLSRITWPEFPVEQVVAAIKQALDDFPGNKTDGARKFQRACIQTVRNNRARVTIGHLLDELADLLPVSISWYPANLEEIHELFSLGADRIGIVEDCPTDSLFREIKGGSRTRIMELLKHAACMYPGRIGTHLIVGLGESEREMVQAIQEVHDFGVTVGLFAFTPVPGTPLGSESPPDPCVYRRIQVARWLIVKNLRRAEQFIFDENGRIVDWGMANEDLVSILYSGKPFETSGCPGCNRPYYNESPGGFMYNYPRPLTESEVRDALNRLGFL